MTGVFSSVVGARTLYLEQLLQLHKPVYTKNHKPVEERLSASLSTFPREIYVLFTGHVNNLFTTLSTFLRKIYKSCLLDTWTTSLRQVTVCLIFSSVSLFRSLPFFSHREEASNYHNYHNRRRDREYRDPTSSSNLFLYPNFDYTTPRSLGTGRWIIDVLNWRRWIKRTQDFVSYVLLAEVSRYNIIKTKCVTDRVPFVTIHSVMKIESLGVAQEMGFWEG